MVVSFLPDFSVECCRSEMAQFSRTGSADRLGANDGRKSIHAIPPIGIGPASYGMLAEQDDPDRPAP